MHGALLINENAIESDRVIPGDKRTMDIIKLIGNDVHLSIQLEVDCPSNYDDAEVSFRQPRDPCYNVGTRRR